MWVDRNFLFRKDKEKCIQIFKLKNAEYQRAFCKKLRHNLAEHAEHLAARKVREHQRNIRKYGEWDALVESRERAIVNLNETHN